MHTQLPTIFLESLKGLKGFDKDAFEKVHQSGEQVTSIRLNPFKIKGLSEDISIAAYLDEKIPWTSNGYYLSQRPSFTLDPAFHSGAYYVQEASSMFIEQALRQSANLSAPIKVLDLCAAPGGKSTLIQSLLNDKSLLVCNEVIKTRVNILDENITKWGAANVIVTNNNPKDFARLPAYFDVIVVDAPCSGSGLFRKDAAAIDEWSLQHVDSCGLRQQRILADILPSLKEGGTLIYSTCSYSEAEDEAIADWLIGEQGLSSTDISIQPEWNIVATKSRKHGAVGYRFYPDKIKGEGFFIAIFTKGGKTVSECQAAKYKSKSEKLNAKDAGVVKPYLKDGENFFFIKQHDEVIALPNHLETELAAIQFSLYIKKAGVTLGSIIRNQLIPAHALALSTVYNSNLPQIEIDKETALQYLRRQEIKISTGVLKDWVLLTYINLPLGWIKILPNRINNYYPKDWRIFNK